LKIISGKTAALQYPKLCVRISAKIKLKKMFKKLFFTCAAFFIFCGAAFCLNMSKETLKWMDESVSAIYALDFDRAEIYIDKIVKTNPDFPIALLAKTMIDWSRFEYEYEKSNPAQAQVFENSISAALESIYSWLEKNAPDAYAYLALGGVYGVKGRFELANRNYISAYFSGRKGLKYMNKAFKLDPQMYDALLGEGVYQYYAGTLPSMIKILAKLVISGNADKGIEYLNVVKDKGRLCADTAKLLLVEIFIESDKYYNPVLAARYINEIIKKYPNNPLYKFVGIIADFENGNYDKVIEAANVFLSKIGREKFYNDIYIARAYTAVGTAQMAKGDFEAAKSTFEKSLKATGEQEMSRWKMWNILRLAQTLDILGKREQAVEFYKSIISDKQNWGIDDIAKQYLKKPFTKNISVGHMSPP
jgi:tetratricopeptide (TPR) repeat protein